MDELTLLVTALTSGAIAGSKGVATQAISDCYAGLKKLITGKSSDPAAIEIPLAQIEKDNDSKIWQAALQDAVRKTGLANHHEVAALAEKLLDLLAKEGRGKTSMQASVSGSGAVAQGTNSVAAGKGGTAIGKVHGDVTIRGK